jgi:DNA-binding response OmpR family regulator
MARVLLVEDEPLIAMMLAEMLAELGHEVVGPARSVAEGLAALADGQPDMAVLDINLDGEMSFPLADALEAAGVPHLFATGYGPEAARARPVSRPVIAKPFSAADLAASLALLDPASATAPASRHRPPGSGPSSAT